MFQFSGWWWWLIMIKEDGVVSLRRSLRVKTWNNHCYSPAGFVHPFTISLSHILPWFQVEKLLTINPSSFPHWVFLLFSLIGKTIEWLSSSFLFRAHAIFPQFTHTHHSLLGRRGNNSLSQTSQLLQGAGYGQVLYLNNQVWLWWWWYNLSPGFHIFSPHFYFPLFLFKLRVFHPRKMKRKTLCKINGVDGLHSFFVAKKERER